jgi:hypothetical protein
MRLRARGAVTAQTQDIETYVPSLRFQSRKPIAACDIVPTGLIWKRQYDFAAHNGGFKATAG